LGRPGRPVRSFPWSDLVSLRSSLCFFVRCPGRWRRPPVRQTRGSTAFLPPGEEVGRSSCSLCLLNLSFSPFLLTYVFRLMSTWASRAFEPVPVLLDVQLVSRVRLLHLPQDFLYAPQLSPSLLFYKSRSVEDSSLCVEMGGSLIRLLDLRPLPFLLILCSFPFFAEDVLFSGAVSDSSPLTIEAFFFPSCREYFFTFH